MKKKLKARLLHCKGIVQAYTLCELVNLKLSLGSWQHINDGWINIDLNGQADPSSYLNYEVTPSRGNCLPRSLLGQRWRRLRDNRPILVTGSHRSGTTWVGRILSLSRSVCYIHETFNVDYPPRIAGKLFDYWFTYITRQNERDFYESLSRVISFRYDLISQLRTVQTRKDFREFREEFIKFSVARILRLRPLLKDPIAIFSAEWLASNFNMSIVVMIRHPAAFVSSVKRLGWNHPFSHFLSQPLLIKEHHIIDQAAFLWKLIHHMIINYRARHNDWIFVRHEDLSREPLTGFNLLFDKLNIKFSPRVQKRIMKYSDVKNPVDSDNPFSIKRNSKSIVKKWQQELSESEITRIRNRVENISNHFYKDEDW